MKTFQWPYLSDHDEEVVRAKRKRKFEMRLSGRTETVKQNPSLHVFKISYKLFFESGLSDTGHSVTLPKDGRVVKKKETVDGIVQHTGGLQSFEVQTTADDQAPTVETVLDSWHAWFEHNDCCMTKWMATMMFEGWK